MSDQTQAPEREDGGGEVAQPEPDQEPQPEPTVVDPGPDEAPQPDDGDQS